MMEVTAPAMSKLKEVLEEQGEKDAALRVIAVPSDQGGVQYMMTMEKEVQKDDTILDMDGIRFVMDSDSEPFLDEATIDYVEELTGWDSSSTTPRSPRAAAVATAAVDAAPGAAGATSPASLPKLVGLKKGPRGIGAPFQLLSRGLQNGVWTLHDAAAPA